MFQPRYGVIRGTAARRTRFGGAAPAGYCNSVTSEHPVTAASAGRDDSPRASGYPGEGLGLPKTGHGSISGMARRLGALFIDWIICTFIVVALIRPVKADVETWTLLIFAGQDYLLTALTGFTIGKRLLGIRVAKLDGTWVGPVWGLLRTVLLLTVVPPLLLNRDLR